MWQKNVRYLDYNASSGITGSVRDQLKKILENTDLLFANPSSQHRLGQQSRQMWFKATQKIAESLGKEISQDQLVFTSSGTEANQTVIRSAARACDWMIIGSGEHSATHDLIPEMSKQIQIRELPLLSNGQYDFEFLKELLADAKQSGRTRVFLSLFWANNETGVLTSLEALNACLGSCGIPVLLHLDAAQVWGKLELDLFKTPAQYVTFSGHKIGSPAGTGVIWIRPGFDLEPLIIGNQNQGRRGGTENLLSILALSFAAEELNPVLFQQHTSPLRERLEFGLSELPVKIWGVDSGRIGNTTRFSMNGFEQYENWVELLDLKGFAVSHGSACKSMIREPSRVLLKMGATRGEALNSIRVSLGLSSTHEDIEAFLLAIRTLLSEKRGPL